MLEKYNGSLVRILNVFVHFNDDFILSLEYLERLCNSILLTFNLVTNCLLVTKLYHIRTFASNTFFTISK